MTLPTSAETDLAVSPWNRGVEAVMREKHHYDEHRRYLLHFLELHDSAYYRWIARGTLKTWDRHVAHLKREWFEGKSTVEVGCGNPRFLLFVKQWGASRAVGVDLSEVFVRRGLSHPSAYVYDTQTPTDPSSIELRFGDINSDTAADLRVDNVCCFQSLHHLDLDAFTETCERITMPGGRVIISDPNGDHPLRGLADRVGRRAGLLSPDEKALSASVVRNKFEAAGFQTELYRAMNPFSELWFHFTELLTPLSVPLSMTAKIPLRLFRPLENALESLWLSRAPRWGWRYLLVFRKPKEAVS